MRKVASALRRDEGVDGWGISGPASNHEPYGTSQGRDPMAAPMTRSSRRSGNSGGVTAANSAERKRDHNGLRARPDWLHQRANGRSHRGSHPEWRLFSGRAAARGAATGRAVRRVCRHRPTRDPASTSAPACANAALQANFRPAPGSPHSHRSRRSSHQGVRRIEVGRGRARRPTRSGTARRVARRGPVAATSRNCSRATWLDHSGTR